ncbi:MAG: DUF423 domain-containing protein [Pseudomonadota bacterium]
MIQLTLTLAAVSGFLCVALGAFGAHALRNRFDDYAMGIFETAVQYQFYHSLALLAVGLLMLQVPGSALLRASALLFIAGICVFSGSLYLLSFSGLRWLGAITPLGGLAFIGGWLCLAAAAWTLSTS